MSRHKDRKTTKEKGSLQFHTLTILVLEVWGKKVKKTKKINLYIINFSLTSLLSERVTEKPTSSKLN